MERECAAQRWEQFADGEQPEELMGPWELQCTLSGAGAMWVELGENGDCSCAARVGKGRQWSARKLPGDAWAVRFVVLDKLSRPLRWEGQVRPDDVRGMVVSGDVRGPPKRGASKADTVNGVVVAEFGGYKLS